MDLKIKNLFEDIKKGLENLKSHQKPSKDFNIFNILGIELLETRHSKFLAELLNPCGSHGYKDLFLKKFLQISQLHQKVEKIDTFCKNAKVETEQFHIVEKQQSYIDITIEYGNDVIVIENKIYAPDQDKQLYRYYKAKKNEKFKNIILIYLTLDGKQPSPESLYDMKMDNICLLSYETHIYKWILSTQKHVKDVEIAHIIAQYIKTLEELTNKNSKKENQVIKNVLMKDDNLKTALKIEKALPYVKATFEKEFYKKLQIKLLKYLDEHSFNIFRSDDFHWNFDEEDVQWIMNLRSNHVSKSDDKFVGLYFYKDLKNGKSMVLSIGETREYALTCECFLTQHNQKLTVLKIKKSDFKDTIWEVQNNFKIIIEGDNFDRVQFNNIDDMYMKSSDEIEKIIENISITLSKIISSEDFKTLIEKLECY